MSFAMSVRPQLRDYYQYQKVVRPTKQQKKSFLWYHVKWGYLFSGVFGQFFQIFRICERMDRIVQIFVRVKSPFPYQINGCFWICQKKITVITKVKGKLSQLFRFQEMRNCTNSVHRTENAECRGVSLNTCDMANIALIL